ncbi:MAG: hypothetical protein ACQESR_08860 [Planctomycetota bacterium]
MESCPAQAVLPLVGLAAEKVIRDRYKGGGRLPHCTGRPLHGQRFLLVNDIDQRGHDIH